MDSIYFAGLLSESNLGDIVIIESTEYLYKQALKDKGSFNFERLNLQVDNLSFFNRVSRKINRTFYRVTNQDSKPYEVHFLKEYYKKKLKHASLIVLVGGGLIKYKYQRVFLYLTALVEAAEEINVPLVINATGVEGYSETDMRCQLLKKALNKDIIKSVTTRDDIKTLEQCYVYNKKIHTAKVADPAVYCNEVYHQQKRPSDIYGIGLVRGGIFLDNERNFGSEKVIIFYTELLQEMTRRNLNYQLFTNGLSKDKELVFQIEKHMNASLTVIEPSKSQNLVATIASFKGVIAARLHANIISYALDIPSVGLVWNDKLALFGKDIGYPERFFEHDKLNAKEIVDALVKATEQGNDNNKSQKYKKTAKENIETIVMNWLSGNL